MSKTKEALEMAIDVMSKYQNGWIPDDMVNALLTCKEVLAEQPTNMVTVPLDKLEDMQRRLKALDRMADNAKEIGLEYCKHGSDSACKECYMENVEQEPVGFVVGIAGFPESQTGLASITDNTLSVCTPLYTRPTKPLSNDEIERLADAITIKWHIYDFDMVRFARAIERAHGIGE